MLGGAWDHSIAPESSHVALDEGAQHFIGFRRMFSVGEMARAIENVHSRIVRVPRNEIE
jgi:hypothetical protein